MRFISRYILDLTFINIDIFREKQAMMERKMNALNQQRRGKINTLQNALVFNPMQFYIQQINNILPITVSHTFFFNNASFFDIFNFDYEITPCVFKNLQFACQTREYRVF